MMPDQDPHCLPLYQIIRGCWKVGWNRVIVNIVIIGAGIIRIILILL